MHVIIANIVGKQCENMTYSKITQGNLEKYETTRGYGRIYTKLANHIWLGPFKFPIGEIPAWKYPRDKFDVNIKQILGPI